MRILITLRNPEMTETIKVLTYTALLYFTVFLFGCNKPTDEHVKLFTDLDDAQIIFALEELKTSCAQKDIKFTTTDKSDATIIVSILPTSTLEHEGFSIKKEGDQIAVYAADKEGAMYGILELAEQVNLYGLGAIQETTQNPYMKMRGMKLNFPLDARTPSYSDICDVTQNNMPEMWSMEFWKEYIDNLARYRYNFVSLWNLHPFPSMVKVPGYEDIALDNVERALGDPEELYKKFGKNFDDPELLGNTEIIKEITIEEKIEFWKEVMAYGKSRNVDFYILTWNIFVYGTNGKHGLSEDIKNKNNLNYFKETIKEMYRTYPDLAGIGLTAGENMDGATFDEKEDWAYETYATGLLDVAEEMPGRKFTFIHRQHMTGAQDIAKKFENVIKHDQIDFQFSYKYAKAHVYSSTQQPYHTQFVKDIAGMETLWELRNDDIYYFRWGAPDFVREFILNIPKEVSGGFHYGSDQWIWGREFTSRNAEKPRKIEIVKHWYHFMMWGRLGYDPTMGNDRFVAMLQNKFHKIDGAKLFEAWQEASMIYPTTTGFHWGNLDYKWYIEACKSRSKNSITKSGFHGVEDFITTPVHELSGFQSIPEYVKMVLENNTTDKKSPLQVSEKLHTHADSALSLLKVLEAGDDEELAMTLHDIKVIGHLGKYYAHKISGSTYVALCRETKDNKDKELAIQELSLALAYWEKFVALAMEQHINPVWMNRVMDVNWVELTEDAKADIEIAKNCFTE